MKPSIPHLHEKLEKTVVHLSAEQLQVLTDFAEYLRSKDEWEATRELLSDPQMRRDIEQGREQKEKGELHPWRSVQKQASKKKKTAMSQVFKD